MTAASLDYYLCPETLKSRRCVYFGGDTFSCPRKRRRRLCREMQSETSKAPAKISRGTRHSNLNALKEGSGKGRERETEGAREGRSEKEPGFPPSPGKKDDNLLLDL